MHSVQLLTHEPFRTLDIRHEWVVPSAGGVEQQVGGDLSRATVLQLDAQRPLATTGRGADPLHRGRTNDGQTELGFISSVVAGDDARRRFSRREFTHRHAREIRNPVGLPKRERIPPVTPRTTRAVVGVQNDEVLPRAQTARDQRLGCRETCLPCADDDSWEVLRQCRHRRRA